MQWTNRKRALACASGWLAMTVRVWATPGQEAYGTIPARNVFHLVSPGETKKPEEPPVLPRIIPSGLITFLGKRALFRVQWTQRNGPAREESYILGEGESVGAIQVLQIDERTGSIKFNNHGTVMLLTLERDGVRPPVALVQDTGVPARPPAAARASTTGLSAEEQMIIMEVEREKSRASIESGHLPPLPPTPLRP